MSEPQPIIEIRNVSKRFGQVTAVDNVSLTINAGEFFVLLGPSGCGKTTLLRMIAGFELPTEGQILIDGQDMARVPPNKRPVNMVFQSYAVFPHMSVADNVGYGLKIAGVGGDDDGGREHRDRDDRRRADLQRANRETSAGDARGCGRWPRSCELPHRRTAGR